MYYAILLLRMENYINRHKCTSKQKGCVDVAEQQGKSTDFGASSVTANLNQKVVKAEFLFSGFQDQLNLRLMTVDPAFKLFRSMFPDSETNNYMVARRQHIC